MKVKFSEPFCLLLLSYGITILNTPSPTLFRKYFMKFRIRSATIFASLFPPPPLPNIFTWKNHIFASYIKNTAVLPLCKPLKIYVLKTQRTCLFQPINHFLIFLLPAASMILTISYAAFPKNTVYRRKGTEQSRKRSNINIFDETKKDCRPIRKG